MVISYSIIYCYQKHSLLINDYLDLSMFNCFVFCFFYNRLLQDHQSVQEQESL